MTEYQKMISSQPYNCMAPELALLRREAEDDAEQRALLADLVGELAENAFICPPLYCTYGCYINMGATRPGSCQPAKNRTS